MAGTSPATTRPRFTVSQVGAVAGPATPPPDGARDEGADLCQLAPFTRKEPHPLPRHKVIFDTDPGIDDAMALLFLDAAPEVELLGITTVLGNGDIETTTRNAIYL